MMPWLRPPFSHLRSLTSPRPRLRAPPLQVRLPDYSAHHRLRPSWERECQSGGGGRGDGSAAPEVRTRVATHRAGDEGVLHQG